MRESMFDESYNIREILDDVIDRVNLRERLIQTARQFNEKKRDERTTLALKQFDNLMQDFLVLYQPILDRLRNYKEALQKDLQGLRTGLATVKGMLDVSRQIEGLAAKTEQLQMDEQELEKTIDDKAKTLGKIDDLMTRIQPYISGTGASPSILQEPMSDMLSTMPKDLFPDTDPTREVSHSSSKRSSRNTS